MTLSDKVIIIVRLVLSLIRQCFRLIKSMRRKTTGDGSISFFLLERLFDLGDARVLLHHQEIGFSVLV